MRAYYSEKVSNFLNASDNEILGQLLMRHNFSDDQEQKRAWAEQITILKNSLKNFPDATIFFEFAIPRMGKRIDNILVLNGIIYLLEFKIFAKTYEAYAIEQVLDYALDLKNFHEGSHSKTLVPILISTETTSAENKICFAQDNISNCIKANKNNLESILVDIDNNYKSNCFDEHNWINASYKPTPTIVEAAQALYANHSVQDISRSDSGAINLSLTTAAVEKIIKESKQNHKKSICFITGVPGAGKTLAGLNIATQSMNYEEDEHACFLSGNGPLVKVLREALIRNKAALEKISKKQAEPQVCAFIQNIHHFRDEYVNDLNAPAEKVVIFDEAQRAWDKEQASKFMNKKSNIKDFDYSEPEFLINVMDRHKDWCVIVCLIGGGQEINTGEAGLEEWFRALKEKFNNWDIYCAEDIQQRGYLSSEKSQDIVNINNLYTSSDLHLNVSLRSFRSEKLSEFVHCIIENRPEKARKIYNELNENYPIYLTRNLEEAKKWICSKTRGTERKGLLAHSNALRLKPEGIFVKSEIDCTNWFLNKNKDIRSSCALEDCATEFDVQGLELDWTIVAWDANLRYTNGNWEYMKFVGDKWMNINKEADKKYLLNSYRVLLTRARQGMIIFVPEGSDKDNTRSTKFYDDIFEYLQSCGIQCLKA